MDIRKLLGRDVARFMGVLGGLAVVAALAGPAPVSAQEPDREREQQECRCVDRDGNPIEDCVCITTPSMDNVFTLATTFPFERRSVVGVTINYDQGSEYDARGARIMDVQADGPADRAGLEEGDIVIRVDGRSVFDALEEDAERSIDESTSLPVQRFVRLVGALEPGEGAEIVVLRGDSERTFTVTPDEADAWAPRVSFFGDDEPGWAYRFDRDELRAEMDEMRNRLREQDWDRSLPGIYRFEGPGERGEVRILGGERGGEPFGMRFRSDPCMELTTGDGEAQVFVLAGGNCVEGVEFMELNADLGEYFGTEEGILVTRVAESSTLGLRAGDVLMAIDGREVRSASHARRILGSYESEEEIRLRIMRQGAETEVLARRD